MNRRSFLAGVAAAFGGCSGLATSDGAPTATRSATGTATSTPAPTPTSTRSRTPDDRGAARFPNSLGTDAYALHLTGVTLRPSIFDRFEGIDVLDAPGLGFLVLETATTVRTLREVPEFADDIRLYLRLDGTETPSPHARTLDTDPFRYAMGVPVGDYGTATVVLTVDGATDTWRVPDGVVERFARTPAFRVVDLEVAPTPATAGEPVTATFTVRNEGRRRARCLYTVAEPDRRGSLDHGGLVVPAGGTATDSGTFTLGRTATVELDVGTDAETVDIVVTDPDGR